MCGVLSTACVQMQNWCIQKSLRVTIDRICFKKCQPTRRNGPRPARNPRGMTPTVPPPPDLSDGTPVYLYAVICSSDCPSGTPPLPFVRRPPGGYINFWRCYKYSQAFLRSRRAAIYDEHSLSELLMTAFKTYKPTLLLAACFLSIGVQASTCNTAGG
jgi:hypothetical protein